MVQSLSLVASPSGDAISCTQLLSNSMICKLSLWFKQNSGVTSPDPKNQGYNQPIEMKLCMGFIAIKACLMQNLSLVAASPSGDAISCTQLLSNSMICKLSLWFQQNSTKESYDTNRIL